MRASRRRTTNPPRSRSRGVRIASTSGSDGLRHRCLRRLRGRAPAHGSPTSPSSSVTSIRGPQVSCAVLTGGLHAGLPPPACASSGLVCLRLAVFDSLRLRRSCCCRWRRRARPPKAARPAPAARRAVAPARPGQAAAAPRARREPPAAAAPAAAAARARPAAAAPRRGARAAARAGRPGEAEPAAASVEARPAAAARAAPAPAARPRDRAARPAPAAAARDAAAPVAPRPAPVARPPAPAAPSWRRPATAGRPARRRAAPTSRSRSTAPSSSCIYPPTCSDNDMAMGWAAYKTALIVADGTDGSMRVTRPSDGNDTVSEGISVRDAVRRLHERQGDVRRALEIRAEAPQHARADALAHQRAAARPRATTRRPTPTRTSRSRW